MPPSHLIIVGSSHQTAPLKLLESLSLAPDEVKKLLPEIKSRAGLEEALLLSTCNRTEIFGTAPNPDSSSRELERWLVDISKKRLEIGPENLYVHIGELAAEHLFRLVCGLDSMMLGETEISGQVQDALDLSYDAGTAGSFFTQLFSAAFRTCKRARRETAISEGMTSVASAAVYMARRIFGELDRRSVLVVGAGETGSLVARHFKELRPKEIVVANRTRSKAEALAREVNGRSVSMSDWARILSAVDIVVSATRSPNPIITRKDVEDAVGGRAARMLLLIDISLPNNVEPSVGEIENVFLHDMNDLAGIVKQNLKRRAKEIPAVEAIIHDEKIAFLGSQSSSQVGPLIKELRDSYENLRKSELERFASKLTDEQRSIADRLTRDLVNKLLHKPTVEIRALGERPEADTERLSWAKRLFGLNGDNEK
jgi:glutamyl-tRNA reductase